MNVYGRLLDYQSMKTGKYFLLASSSMKILGVLILILIQLLILSLIMMKRKINIFFQTEAN